jgi:high-affinity Fe2+/Pb2+ permease
MVRVVFGVGTVTALVLAYLLSNTSRVEAIVLPGIVMSLVLFGVALYSRARTRQEWSAAWDAYARSEVSVVSFDAPVDQKTFSWANSN